MKIASYLHNCIMDQQQTPKTEYDEINLADYIRIIIKRKTLILSFLLIGLIIAGGLTFLLPINYKIRTFLEVGIEYPLQVAEKINSNFYGDYLGIEATNPSRTDLIKIEIVSRDPEDAKRTLENINKSILEDYNQKMEAKKEILENSIKELKERINFLLPRSKEVEMLELEIIKIQKQIDDVQPTEVIKEPIVVSGKKPNLLFNLICGGLFGIFLGLFSAFGKEWWTKS